MLCRQRFGSRAFVSWTGVCRVCSTLTALLGGPPHRSDCHKRLHAAMLSEQIIVIDMDLALLTRVCVSLLPDQSCQ